MRSDKASLDVIVDKLESIEKYNRERSFLSRLDMMFSVLVSLTLFISSLLLAGLKPAIDAHIVIKWGFSYFVSLYVLLIYTLIGELYAIIKDHETLRFTYWMILLIGISLLTIQGAFSLQFFLPIEIVLGLGLVFAPVGFVLIFLMRFVESLYQRYIGNLCYRTPRSKDKRNWLVPLCVGLIILLVVALATYISISI